MVKKHDIKDELIVRQNKKKSIENDSLPVSIKFNHKNLAWWKKIESIYEKEPVKTQKNAYLNFLMSIGILDELETDNFLNNEAIHLVPSRSELINIWKKKPGVRIELGNTSLLFIPTNKYSDKLQVSYEWIDFLPSQYYIAVNIDTDNNQLDILGGTTHSKLTSELGQYNPQTQNYEIDQLFAWSTILVARKHCPEAKPIINSN